MTLCRRALGIVRTTIKELSEKKKKRARSNINESNSTQTTINIDQEKKQFSKR
ncbi:hypothetical protein Glove_91g101 [Diversispora epigaea]|uniref:Uncharacterized protein n=1 Tax=Diversispora epigaea TaxID=1348612 RepID=A0A397J7R5_9GLOM|nr:hypothetical protein Glove_91g101 [Diversispora epigaea]